MSSGHCQKHRLTYNYQTYFPLMTIFCLIHVINIFRNSLYDYIETFKVTRSTIKITLKNLSNNYSCYWSYCFLMTIFTIFLHLALYDEHCQVQIGSLNQNTNIVDLLTCLNFIIFLKLLFHKKDPFKKSKRLKNSLRFFSIILSIIKYSN